jgi:ankyrin repeat protein
LELGAKTKVTGYSVTPLQIAATSWDLQGVRILLEAGADPKNIGDSGGMTWAEDSLMGRYNCLRDSSPLNIARRVRIKSYPAYLQDEESEDDSADIEALLLQHGAKEGEISSLAGVEVL